MHSPPRLPRRVFPFVPLLDQIAPIPLNNLLSPMAVPPLLGYRRWRIHGGFETSANGQNLLPLADLLRIRWTPIPLYILLPHRIAPVRCRTVKTAFEIVGRRKWIGCIPPFARISFVVRRGWFVRLEEAETSFPPVENRNSDERAK